MKVKVLVLAALTFGCGAVDKPKFVQDAQSLFEQARIDLVNGGNWLFDRIKSGVDFTTKELDSCFSGGCDLREAMRGPEGSKGKTGDKGDNGTDGVNGTNGVDGADGRDGTDGSSCAVLEVSNGAVITCGDSTAVVYNGRDGVDGIDGENGTDGADGRDGVDGINGVDGKDGKRGPRGRQGPAGEDGQDGTSCNLTKENERCYGPHLRYDLYIVCGEDSQNLGRFTKSHGCDD